MAASGYELNLNLDFSKALQQAAQFEQKLKDLTTQATTLETALSKAGNALSGSNADVLNRIKSALEQIGNKTAINIDTSKVNEVYTALDKVVETMRILTDPKKANVTLLDTQGVYATSKGLLEVGNRVDNINAKIEKVKKDWSRFNAQITNISKSNTMSSDEKKEAISKVKQNRAGKEAEMLALIEQKAIADKELKYAKMTQDQKAEYLRKTLQKMLAEERKFANGVRKEYSTTTKELVSVLKQSEKLSKVNVGGVHDGKLQQLEARYIELNNKRIAMEQQYGNVVVDVARNTQRQVWDIEAKRIQDKQKAEQKVQEAQWQKYLSSPEGALTLAKDAKTMGEMKEAQAYLKKALDNVNVTDAATIKKLNDEYTRLRATIEKLTSTTKNEQTLQPTLANEYKRLLTELDKVRDAKKRLEETSSYKSGNAKAMSAMDDLVARETDVQNRILQIRQNAQGKLDEVDRKHNAQRATESIAEFERAERRKDEIMRQGMQRRSKYGIVSTDSASRLIGVADNVKNVVQAERAMNAMREAIKHLDKDSANYQQTVDKLKNKIKELEKFTQSATKSTTQTVAMNDRQAMAFSRSAKSIEEQNRAIKALKIARDNLNRGDFSSQSAYDKRVRQLTAEIHRQTIAVDTLTAKQQQLGQSKMTLMNHAAQLQRQLAMVFSVSAIKGYINKLIAVRGEFELQQKALSAILQSKDQADELWNQTVKLAIKSPFTIKELSGYTKQLAAYRIETDKLHDTTKRLADVSAGLGVDMQRIILAYGQVRAASYLRGTELRQFTEAGIPMLEELARHFSDLEGRAVSVGDVFGRISKRLVSFKDVEVVFKKMTSAGGVFFEMQEKQADTLKGMVSNLKDRISIMLNDIGRANEDTLKSGVWFVQEFVKNWREVWNQLQVLIPLFATWRIAMFGLNTAMKANATTTLFWSKSLTGIRAVMAKEILELKKAELAALGMNRAQIIMARGLARVQLAFKGLWMMLKSFIPILAITAIFEVYQWLTASSRAASELRNELSLIAKEVDKELTDSVKRYKELASAISSATLSYKERNEAMQALNREFGEILPKQLLEVDYIKQMANGYKEATDALKLHYDEKELRLKRDKIEEKYGGDIETDKNDLRDELIDSSVIIGTRPDGSKQTVDFLKYYKLSALELEKILSRLIKDIKEGNVTISDSSELATALFEKITSYTGREFKRLQPSDFYHKNIYELTEDLIAYNNAWSDATTTIGATQKETVMLESVRVHRDEYDEKSKTIQKLSDAYSDYYNKLNAIQKKEETGSEVTKEERDALKDMVNDIKMLYTALGLKIPEDNLIKEYASDMMALESETERIITQVTENFIKNMKSQYKVIDGIEYEGNTEMKKFEENLVQRIESLNDSDFVSTVKEIYLDIIDKYNLPSNAFDQLIPDKNVTVDDLTKQISEKIETLRTEEAKFEKALRENIAAMGEEKGTEQTEKARGFDKEEIEKFKKLIPAYEKALARLGGVEDKNSDAWSKRIQILTDAHKTYVKHNELVDATTSRERVLTSHAEDVNAAFEDLGYTINDIKFDDLDWIISFLDTQLLKLSQTKKEYHTVAKALADFRGEQQATDDKQEFGVHKQDLENAFSQYELGLEISKLNLPKDVAKQLFGIDVLDLQELKDFIYNIDLSQFGTEYIKEYDQALAKIDELEQKEQAERLKKYSKYLVKAQAERVKIKMEELHQLAEIEQTYAFDETTAFQRSGASVDAMNDLKESADRTGVSIEHMVANLGDFKTAFSGAGFTEEQIQAMVKYYNTLKSSSELARQGLKEETQTKMDKQVWEDFKGSKMYEQLFGDLENLGSKSLEMLMTKLKGMKDALKTLPPEAYKEIKGAMDKIENIQMERNPFVSFFDAIKEAKKSIDIKDIEGNVTKSVRGETAIATELKAQQQIIDAEIQEQTILEAIKNANGDISKIKDEALREEIEANEYAGKSAEEYNKLINASKERQENAEENANALGVGLDNITKARTATEKTMDAAKKWGDSINGVLKGVDSVLEAFGVAEDDTARLWINNTIQIVNMIVQTYVLIAAMVAMEVATKSAAGVIGWIAMALEAVALLLSSIFSSHDKGLERQIEKEKEAVESLEKAYKKLEKSIEDAYSLTTLKAANELAEQNLKMQRNHYREMQRLEEEKKNTDKEKIKDYQDSIDEIGEQIEQLQIDRVSEVTAGILGSAKDAARNFVDAWLDAFNETGDGLSGLKDSFKEITLDMVKQQASLLIAGTYLDRWKDMLSAYINKDDLELTSQEAAKWIDEVQQQLPLLNEQLEAYFRAMEQAGVDLDGTGEQLSGLQKGIQGITETQADIIAAYLNSIRFYVADSNVKLNQLLAMQTNEEIPNPMLSQLKIIASQTTAINTLLGSVTKSGHSAGGRGIKVFIS